MSEDNPIKNPGPADIQLGALQLWVRGPELSDSRISWDEVYPFAIAHCGAAGASVWISGHFLTLKDLDHWMHESEHMYRTLMGRADLICTDQDLIVLMEMTTTGRIEVEVHITPNKVTQVHQFKFSIDQSYLPDAIEGCKQVLSRFQRGIERNQ